MTIPNRTHATSGPVAPECTVAIPGGNIPTGTTLELTASCPGAAVGDVVTCSPAEPILTPVGLYACVETVGVVTVVLTNPSAGSLDPGANSVRCIVLG